MKVLPGKAGTRKRLSGQQHLKGSLFVGRKAMGEKRSSEAPTEAQRAATARELDALFDLHLDNFQENLAHFTDCRFGLTTPRALQAAESMYFESVLDEAKEFVAKHGALLSSQAREALSFRVTQRLLLDERIGALSQLCHDPLFRPSANAIEVLRPLAEYTCETSILFGRVFFVGDVMRSLCASFAESERYERAVRTRLTNEILSGTLASAADILSDLPVPRRLLGEIRPQLEQAISRHLQSRCHPEPIVIISRLYGNDYYLHTVDGLAALEDSCCQALQNNDIQYVLDVLQEIAGTQLASFDQILTARVRQEGHSALIRAREERDYFQAYSETPEPYSRLHGVLSTRIRALTHILSATTPSLPPKGKMLRGGLTSMPEEGPRLGEDQQLPS